MCQGSHLQNVAEASTHMRTEFWNGCARGSIESKERRCNVNAAAAQRPGGVVES